MYALTDYHYELPEALIAQVPVAGRDGSRLLRLKRGGEGVSHHRFRDIVRFFTDGDILVVNNTQVIPARLTGRKATGGRVELLVLEEAREKPGAADGTRAVRRCLIKASKRPAPGTRLIFGPELAARVESFDGSVFTVTFESEAPFDAVVDRIGSVPLPPYIRRETPSDQPCDDRHVYQTVYASQRGAVAAPTAGLHFTRRLLDRIRSAGVAVVEITLHVGYGTFSPVRAADIREHRMHAERYTLTQQAADVLNAAKGAGRRIIAVGTTSVRTLEHAAADGRLAPGSGTCDLFIYPGYRFRMVDALITNFHLPGSTLLMLVSAFAGRENVLSAYREAVREQYRFFSYGDAMLID